VNSPDADVRARRRIVLARVLAWFFAAIAAVPMFGLIDLGTVFGLADPQWEWQISLEASWGSLLTFIIAGGFGWIGALPDRPWPGLGLLGLASISLAIASLVFLDTAPLWVAVALAGATAAIYLLLRPGPPPGRLGRPPGWVWSSLVAAGVPLWLGYAWNTYAAALRGDTGDVTNGIDHWPVQVALGLTLAAGAALLVAWRTELVLWRVAFALAAAIVAYASIAYPERGGAMPHWAWGVAIAVWGAILLVPDRRTGGVTRRR